MACFPAPRYRDVLSKVGAGSAGSKLLAVSFEDLDVDHRKFVASKGEDCRADRPVNGCEDCETVVCQELMRGRDTSFLSREQTERRAVTRAKLTAFCSYPCSSLLGDEVFESANDSSVTMAELICLVDRISGEYNDRVADSRLFSAAVADSMDLELDQTRQMIRSNNVRCRLHEQPKVGCDDVHEHEEVGKECQSFLDRSLVVTDVDAVQQSPKVFQTFVFKSNNTFLGLLAGEQCQQICSTC